VVLKPVQINPLHCVAQLQVDYHQIAHFHGTRIDASTFLLRRSWVFSEKAARCIKNKKAAFSSIAEMLKPFC
jgi:hypothetical protein